MDPVRFLSNPSTGALGLAIAETLRARGVRVTLVLGPTHLKPSPVLRVVRVETAREMLGAVRAHLKTADAFIATAAVGDWRFAKTNSRKLKKETAAVLTARLVKNPDILAWVGNEKKRRAAALLVIGFALETDRLRLNAERKRREKNLDLIIANGPASFAADEIHARWIEDNYAMKNLGRLKKTALAARLAAWLDKKWKTTPPRA
jgi:phosphopantothenoylcysteine decarboxylase/phosphopantothenate--cysteine ligase